MIDDLAEFLGDHSLRDIKLDIEGSDQLADPHNPPGHLLMLRKEDLRVTGMVHDAGLYRRMNAAGWKAAITGAVVRRYLSLHHFFDYPDYDAVARDDFVNATRGKD